MAENFKLGSQIILELEKKFISKHRQDPEKLITPPEKIVKTEFNQNPDGSWAKTQFEEKNNQKRPTKILKEEEAEIKKKITYLFNIAAAADLKILNINNQINDKKEQIITTITDAIGTGVSMVSGSFDDVYGTGVSVGSGNTGYKDRGYVHEYPNITVYSAETPFLPELDLPLTLPRIGIGDSTVIISDDLDSPISGFTTDAILVDLTPPPFPPYPDGTPFFNEVVVLANEIEALRNQRDSININALNKIKREKTIEEMNLWSWNKADDNIKTRTADITTAINSINIL